MGRLAVAAIVSLWVIPISILVDHIVPEPYMDEIFHVPQAQQYCKGNFRSWDPMITTPPGLYCLSLGHVACLFQSMSILGKVSSFADICSTAVLRFTNSVLAIICSVLLYEIIIELKPTIDSRKATFYALVLALYPLHWFFTYLYYTDVASLTMFLAMYLASLKKRYWLSALFGALTVVIRQTNIIWMLFVACSGVVDRTFAHRKNNGRVDNLDKSLGDTNQLTQKEDFVPNTGLKQRRVKRTREAVSGDCISNKMATRRTIDAGFLDELRTLFVASWHLKWELLLSFSPFILVLVAFVAFVRWNGSVVLGAKEEHAVSPHFAQLMYFALVSVLASAPFHFNINQVATVLSSSCNKMPISAFIASTALAAGLALVHFFSISHPYLLADNRHYPFYLWRKIINAHWAMKYLLVPLYVYSWFSIANILGKLQKRIWVLGYFLACATVLIPAPLIEFRYYTIPFYILMLHMRIEDDIKWILMGTGYVTVNAFTMYMFLFRPFHWSHEAGVQRFIW